MRLNVERGRPLKRRNNFWRNEWWPILVEAAKQTTNDKTLWGELINIGWMRVARYKSNKDYGIFKECKRAMWQHLLRIRKPIPKIYAEGIKSSYTPDYDSRLMVKDIFQLLLPKEAKMLKERYIESKSLEEIAEQEKITSEAIRIRIKHILEKLRRTLDNE